MPTASATLQSGLQSLRVEPEFERGVRVLIEHARRTLPEVDEDRIRRAFHVAYWAHRDHRRASGELYIAHPLEVATIAARDIRFDEDTVIASLLHDTVEDTDLSLSLIESEFGPEIAAITDGVTKIGHVFESRAMGRAENVRKLMLSMASDIRVILVKFADRLHNMRTLGALPHRKRVQIATETIDLYVPLAHRFGLHEVKTEFEDLALKFLEPEAFQEIARGLNAKKRQRQRFIDRFIEPLRNEIEGAGFSFDIYGRPKSIHSIWRKMKRQDVDLDGIYDLFAVRIILHSEGKKGKEDCWRVYSLLSDLYTPIPERFRDFLTRPKSNGYQSLHTTVIGPEGRSVEIQIRTAEMHEIAERGVAAHWKYKEQAVPDDSQVDGAVVPKEAGRDAHLDAMYAWARDLLENPREGDASEFVRDFHLQLYDEEIYVFTPRGDLVTLPQGATPVDFAFQIHSEVGAQCIGAKVNGKMVPLSHRLSSGDQIEVLTSKKQTPNPDWMSFVVTHKARTRIRHWINEKRRKAVDHGRALVEKRMKRVGLSVDKQTLERVTAQLKFPSTQQLYYEIGSGLYDAAEFVDQLRNRSTPDPEPEAGASPARLEVEQIAEGFTEVAREHGSPSLIIDGEAQSGMAVEYATCCSPIPGDEVFGFISKTGAIKIHRTSCKNAPHLLLDRAERTIDVEWSRQKDVQFVAALR
ncbi:MAG: bifunctional (p)ppGpp synthetase/guanosine-3',5'-bis(diphosphate) 3'-pyrophosphohydrolase, partial [Bacteroidota bacterium]